MVFDEFIKDKVMYDSVEDRAKNQRPMVYVSDVNLYLQQISFSLQELKKEILNNKELQKEDVVSSLNYLLHFTGEFHFDEEKIGVYN